MNIAITIDGRRHFVDEGTTVFEAARGADVYIPHFCFHSKLSLAANCRMCLVQVDKIANPVPACVTYVTDGMVVNTKSPVALAAQKGVMELLLINHPLDCPICDQGGECQLQDLATGYGVSESRFGESKRVVVEKRLGPLITTAMTRCIHCTRCVRFGNEIAGSMELGLTGRGEQVEIMPFVAHTVDSELSGNMIDVCPVGALNSKPFQFSARTWELKRKLGLATHDSWGSRCEIHTKNRKIMRVLPAVAEDINECWLSDRDRFAYTGVGVPGRLVQPLLREGGARLHSQVEWSEALAAGAARIRKAIDQHGPEQVGFLLAPNTISEVALLAGNMAHALGVANIDSRLRQTDFSLDGEEAGPPWLGTTIAKLEELPGIFLIGSNPALELPLLPLRLRRLGSARKTGGLVMLGSRYPGNRLEPKAMVRCRPSQAILRLAQIVRELADSATQAELPDWITALPPAPEEVGPAASAIRAMGPGPAVLLGLEAVHARSYSQLRRLAILVAKLTDGFQGQLLNGANALGIALAGAVPHHGLMYRQQYPMGLNAVAMIEQKLKAYVLIGCEPLDFADPQAASEAFGGAESVIALNSYAEPAQSYADLVMPSALSCESSGAMVNLEGGAYTFYDEVSSPGETRPAWKILRMIGNILGLGGLFDAESYQNVRDELIAVGDFSKVLNNCVLNDSLPAPALAPEQSDSGFERIVETSHFAMDAQLRWAGPLQDTAIARAARTARFHPDDLARLGLAPGAEVVLSTASAELVCPCGEDPQLAPGCVRAPWGQAEFAVLGAACQVTARAAAQSEKERRVA